MFNEDVGIDAPMDDTQEFIVGDRVIVLNVDTGFSDGYKGQEGVITDVSKDKFSAYYTYGVAFDDPDYDYEFFYSDEITNA